ncbi:MAG: MFS transporter [Chloroflexota bacterium]|nr:MFS transporter [Chloroflexota bacterium]
MAEILGSLDDVKQPQSERKFLLGTLTFGHTVIHWYQQMFPVFLPMIKADLGLSAVQVGGLMTAKQGASGLLTLPSGFAADAFNKHKATILGSALVMGGLAYVVASIAPTYFWVLVFLTMLGAASALWHPSSVSTLSLQFSDRRGTAIALHGVGASIGDSVGPLCIGAMLLVVGWKDLAQWHLIPALILAFLMWRTVRQHYSAGPGGLTRRSYFSGIKGIFARPTVFMVMIASSFVGMARLSVTTFLPLYLAEEMNYDSFWLGFHWALLYAMGIFSQPLMGILSDKFSRKTVLLPSFATMGILYLLLPMPGGGFLLALIIAAMGMFFYGTGNIATAAVLDVASEQVQGTTQSFMTLFQQVVTLPAPIVAGFVVSHYGYATVFYYSSALLFSAAAVWAFIRIPKRATGTGGGGGGS